MSRSHRCWVYGRCWYKLSLSNVDCLSLIMHTAWWLSCWVNTDENSGRTERKQRRGRVEPFSSLTHQMRLIPAACLIFSRWLKGAKPERKSAIAIWRFPLKKVLSERLAGFTQMLFHQPVGFSKGKELAPCSGLSPADKVCHVFLCDRRGCVAGTKSESLSCEKVRALRGRTTPRLYSYFIKTFILLYLFWQIL